MNSLLKWLALNVCVGVYCCVSMKMPPISAIDECRFCEAEYIAAVAVGHRTFHRVVQRCITR